MENQSRYDPERKTVGAIYRDAAMRNKEETVVVGDLTNEMMSSLVEDLNETIVDGTLEFGGKPFYIIVHEKKDAQMPRAILRRMLKSSKRPYPEDDTLVFHISDPVNGVIKFCWCLPHWSEMDNMLANEGLFDPNLIQEIRAWKRVDLYHFGFTKDQMGNWMPNPLFEDKPMGESKQQFKLYRPEKFI